MRDLKGLREPSPWGASGLSHRWGVLVPGSYMEETSPLAAGRITGTERTGEA